MHRAIRGAVQGSAGRVFSLVDAGDPDKRLVVRLHARSSVCSMRFRLRRVETADATITLKNAGFAMLIKGNYPYKTDA